MGDLNIEGSKWPLVEVGRVVLLNGDHPDSGKLATIVEIIDHKRVRLLIAASLRGRLSGDWDA